jgi:O-methyltransferase involved in polyketide biosynthesis
LPETLLIPLWCRARETLRSDAVLRDPDAVRILAALEYDFSRFERAWMTPLGIAVRTKLIDDAVRDFLARHPGATVVNLAAGLDTRMTRLDDGNAQWYDLDLPEVIELRRAFFPESSRHHLLAKSALDFSWTEDITSGGAAILFIAEGFLLYLPEQHVREIFLRIGGHFPGSEMLFDALGAALVGKSRRHDMAGKIPAAEFLWGMKDSRTLEIWDPHIQVIAEWFLTDFHRKRWKWFGRVTRWRFLQKRLDNRVVQVRFKW